MLVRRDVVKEMIQSVRPNLVCLQETKLNQIDNSLRGEFLGNQLDSFEYIPADGTRGGILIAWRSDMVEATGTIKKDFSISMHIKLKWMQTPFLLTTVYGPSEDSLKPHFMDELLSLKPQTDYPWLYVGDFNLICDAADKNNLNINRRLMGAFRRALDQSNLIELTLQNRRYTWSNKRATPTLVRLDRAFCNEDWDLLHPGAGLQALSSSLSDHCPLLLCQQVRSPRVERFKFETFWFKVPGFMDTVKMAWEAPTPGRSPMNILYYRLRQTAKALRQWSKELFGNPRMQLHMANEVILRLDIAQEQPGLTPEEITLRRDLKIRVLGLAAVERSRRRQASRVIWIREGDACTRFFHLRANGRRRILYIPHLRRPNGDIVYSHPDKEDVLHEFYEKLLGSKITREARIDWSSLAMPQLGEHQLDHAFTEEEIQQVVMDLPSEKSPGPDGFTSNIYKVCWPIIK